jgi:hypothetical protein
VQRIIQLLIQHGASFDDPSPRGTPFEILSQYDPELAHHFRSEMPNLKRGVIRPLPEQRVLRFHLQDAQRYQLDPVPLRVLVFVSGKDEQAMAAILRELSAAQSKLSEVALVLYLPSSDSSLLPVFHRFMVSERDHALPALRLATRGFPLRAFQPKVEDEPELVAAELVSFVRRHIFDITNGWYDALEEVTLDEAVDFENGRLESRVCPSPRFARAEDSLLLAGAEYSTLPLALAMIGRRSSLCRVVWSTAQEALAKSRRELEDAADWDVEGA